MTSGEFVAYYLLLILVNQVTLSQANWTLGEVIRSGGLSAWLLRPVSPLFNVLSSDVAGKVVEICSVGREVRRRTRVVRVFVDDDAGDKIRRRGRQARLTREEAEDR